MNMQISQDTITARPIYKWWRDTGRRGSGQRATGEWERELPAVESYQWQWAGWSAEASSRELLAHGFVSRATNYKRIRQLIFWSNSF